VDNSAVFGVGNFADANFVIPVRGDPARVEHLTPTRGIESGAVKNQSRTRAIENILDLGVEIVKEGIVIIEACGHGENTI
jgi:hypothetical protein